MNDRPCFFVIGIVSGFGVYQSPFEPGEGKGTGIQDAVADSQSVTRVMGC